MAIYTSGLEAIPGSGDRPDRIFAGRRFLRGPWFRHTRADPFLFVQADRLFLFYEAVRAHGPGSIDLLSTADLVDWTDHGSILTDATHLSYPNAFRHGDGIFLIPESQQAGEVRLYRLHDFPHGRATLERVLLREPVNDPTPFFHDDHWYLFATTPRGLCLYVAKDLLTDTFRPHPVGVIEPSGPRARCGGAILRFNGRWVRPAQNGVERYGHGVDLHEIVRLSPQDYAERLIGSDVLSRDAWWNRRGSHHIGRTSFRDRTIWAIDGQRADHFHHKVTNRVGALLRR